MKNHTFSTLSFVRTDEESHGFISEEGHVVPTRPLYVKNKNPKVNLKTFALSCKDTEAINKTLIEGALNFLDLVGYRAKRVDVVAFDKYLGKAAYGQMTFIESVINEKKSKEEKKSTKK